LTCPCQDGFVKIVPNVIDPANYIFRPELGPRHPIFVGRLDYYPNIEATMIFVGEILPRLRDMMRAVRASVIGHRPPHQLRSLCARGKADLVADVADAAPYLHGSVLMVPLLTGSGSRLKILEAFASGTPVISTAKGIEGIDAIPNKEFWPAESALEFSQAFDKVHSLPCLTSEVLHSAHQLVCNSYSVQAAAARMRAALSELVT
jgi:glycosyltransferase involved in cell wall biosynthesis